MTKVELRLKKVKNLVDLGKVEVTGVYKEWGCKSERLSLEIM